MMMYPPDEKRYPHLARFIKGVLPLLPIKKPLVFKALCTFGQMSPKLASEALSPNGLPMLRAAAMGRNLLEGSVVHYGSFQDSRPSLIFLADVVARAFEEAHEFRGISIPGSWASPARHQFDDHVVAIEEFVEAVLLHEMVHWGDYNADLVHDDFGRESGHAFERAAYNGRIDLTNPRFAALRARFF